MLCFVDTCDAVVGAEMASMAWHGPRPSDKKKFFVHVGTISLESGKRRCKGENLERG